MTQKNKDIKEYVRSRDNGICQNCGTYCWENGNIAHRISQSKHNIKVYGKDIIDHPLNKLWTCFSFTCNDSFNIGNNPGKSKFLMSIILDNNYYNWTIEEINKMLENY